MFAFLCTEKENEKKRNCIPCSGELKKVFFNIIIYIYRGRERERKVHNLKPLNTVQSAHYCLLSYLREKKNNMRCQLLLQLFLCGFLVLQTESQRVCTLIT